MHYAMRLFFGFKGRIARRTWWVAILVISVVEIAFLAATDPNYYTAPVASLSSTIAGIVFLVPMIAVVVKRCNDRNWPWWLGYAVHLPLLAFIIGDYLGHFADDENLTYFQGSVFGSFLVALIFVVVDNGFLRGTVGPNRYGPDPLEPTTPSSPQS